MTSLHGIGNRMITNTLDDNYPDATQQCVDNGHRLGRTPTGRTVCTGTPPADTPITRAHATLEAVEAQAWTVAAVPRSRLIGTIRELLNHIEQDHPQ